MTKIRPTNAKSVDSLVNNGVKGEHSAGKGLFLLVAGKGSASWIHRFQMDKKRYRLGLGSVTGVTLSEARAKVADNQKLIAQGINPLQIKHEELKNQQEDKTYQLTFDDIAADYIQAQRPGWKNAKHAQQWENTLATYASPIIGHLTPAEISTDHILKVLNPIWNSKKDTANRVRNRIELVLNAAKARKLRTGENVAAWRGHLELLLTNHQRNARRHHPALPWQQMSSFWQKLSHDDDTGTKALQLTILTGLRTREVLEARWSEIDFETGIWTVPAERMKASKEHRVPLSGAAISVLKSLPQVANGLLFAGRNPDKPVSNMVMLMKLRRMDERKYKLDGLGWRDAKGGIITTHGFRSTFRDWAAEATSYENIVVEQALAHSIGNAVEAAYRRGDLLERRRELMESWSKYVTSD